MKRLLLIVWVFVRFRLDDFIPRHQLPRSLRLLSSPLLLLPAAPASRAQRLRLALEQLGPIFIKFGQMLSTRRDLLDDELADELARLQDRVPPFDGEAARQLIEASLGQPVDALFDAFSATPLASASIAQVHSACLKSGQQVVIKVVRPGIEHIIEQDVALLARLAGLIERFHPDGKRLRAVEVVSDYRHIIHDELDLQREAANTSQLRRNFSGSPLLYVPDVYWDYCTRKVLVMERIHGIPVTDITALREQGTNLRKLAERGVEIFFTQVFRDSFFHADMHPGNIFVSREHPENPQYIAIDCAIIGSLSEFDQYYLARNLLAIFQRDYRLVAKLHVECGWVPAHTRETDFESAIRAVCEPIFEKPLGEISFGQLLLYLFQTARRFDMEVQPSLILLQKTLLNVEGLGRQLYPDLDLWSTAQPFLENWIRERYSARSLMRQLQRHAPGWLEQLPHIPDLVLERLSAPGTAPRPAPDDNHELLRALKTQQRLNLLALTGLLACAILLVMRL